MFTDVNSITIVNGSNGNIIEVNNKHEKEKICSYFEKINGYKIIDFLRGGYDYYMDFYCNDKALHRIYFMEPKIEVDGSYYWLKDDNEISLNELILSLQDSN